MGEGREDETRWDWGGRQTIRDSISGNKLRAAGGEEGERDGVAG